jgi:hypothetical protein
MGEKSKITDNVEIRVQSKMENHRGNIGQLMKAYSLEAKELSIALGEVDSVNHLDTLRAYYLVQKIKKSIEELEYLLES